MKQKHRELLQNIIYVLFILIAIIGVFFLPEAVVISVNPSSQSVQQGKDFSINISIDPVNNPITAAQFNFIFNSSNVEVKNVTEGNLLKQNGANTTFNSGILNNSRGTLINVWGLIITPGTNVTKKDTFATITLHAKASGNSPLNLANVIVSYPDSQAAWINIVNGTVSLVPFPSNSDLNSDGIVNKSDIDIIINHLWDVTSPPYPNYDVNADGIVNVKDARLVSKNI